MAAAIKCLILGDGDGRISTVFSFTFSFEIGLGSFPGSLLVNMYG